jgi:hypothetical protein
LDGCAATFPYALHVLVLNNGAGHKAQAVRWPTNVVPVLSPPLSSTLHPIELIWCDHKYKLADVPPQTLVELSDALCAIIQHSSSTTLQSLTNVAYFVQEIETAR